MNRATRFQLYFFVIATFALYGIFNYQRAARRKHDLTDRLSCISKVVRVLKTTPLNSRTSPKQIVLEAFSGTECVASKADLKIEVHADHFTYSLRYSGRSVSGRIIPTAAGGVKKVGK